MNLVHPCTDSLFHSASYSWLTSGWSDLGTTAVGARELLFEIQISLLSWVVRVFCSAHLTRMQQISEKPNVVQEYETGQAIPDSKIINKMEKALGVKLPRK